MSDQRIIYPAPKFPEDKLSEEGTRARRNLIAAMATWLLIVPLGMLPKKIALFEIDLMNVPVSVPDLISGAAIYFWLSFLIYAFKDFVGWVHSAKTAIGEQRKQVNSRRTDIEDAESMLTYAKEQKYSEDAVLDIHFRSSAASTTQKISKLKQNIPIWSRHLRHDRWRLFQIWMDVILRTSWDFALPAVLVAGPAWHFLR